MEGNEECRSKIPLIEDITMEVAKKFGMIQPSQSNTQAVRAVFVIDPQGIIRTILTIHYQQEETLMKLKELFLLYKSR